MQAFTAAHSTAEIFRLETIESVFGPIADLDEGMARFRKGRGA